MPSGFVCTPYGLAPNLQVTCPIGERILALEAGFDRQQEGVREFSEVDGRRYLGAPLRPRLLAFG